MNFNLGRDSHHCNNKSGVTCNVKGAYNVYLDNMQSHDHCNNYFVEHIFLNSHIKQHIENSDGTVHFYWKIEPSLVNQILFFKKLIGLQNKYANDKTIRNTLHIDDLVLNETWCEFLNDYNWCVSLTIDGPSEFNDVAVKGEQNKELYSSSADKIMLLRHYQIEFSLCVVLNAMNIHFPEKTYHYIKSLGATYIQFTPFVELKKLSIKDKCSATSQKQSKASIQVTPCSVSASEFGEFLARVFYIWVRKDIGRVFVQIFESTLATWCGLPIKEYVYQNRYLSAPDIGECNKSDLIKPDSLSVNCKKCQFLNHCRGGFSEHRFVESMTGENNHNYFCNGYLTFYRHATPYMNTMRGLITRHISPSELMTLINQREKNKKTQL